MIAGIRVYDENGREVKVVPVVRTSQPDSDGDTPAGPIPRIEVSPITEWGPGWNSVVVPLPEGVIGSTLADDDGHTSVFHFRSDSYPAIIRVAMCPADTGRLSVAVYFSEPVMIVDRTALEGGVSIGDVKCGLEWQLQDGSVSVEKGFVTELYYSCLSQQSDLAPSLSFAAVAFGGSSGVPRLIDGAAGDLELVYSDSRFLQGCNHWFLSN
jgi:hypothetical protein